MESLFGFMIYLLGMVAGATIYWLAVKRRTAQLRDEIRSETSVEVAAMRERLQAKETSIISMRLEADERRGKQEAMELELRTLTGEKAELSTKLTEQTKALEEKLQAYKDLEGQLKDTFTSLSSSALHANSKTFMEMAKAAFEKQADQTKSDIEKRHQNFTDILLPVKESLAKVDGKIQDMEKARVGAYESIHEQVKSLVESQNSLRSETANLSRALRAPNTAGRWGEIQLKRVVELAGMLEHCDFFQQQTNDSESGRYRPDLIVRLPGDKNIVVDAKAPLHAYLEASDMADDTARGRKLVEHAAHVKRHIQRLSQKAYWEQFTPAPEFVVMFIPGEPIFSAALEADPSLIEQGVEQRVIMATPTTLIALLRAVAYGWRQESLTSNAKQVCDLGKELYIRVADLSGHMSDLGTRIGATVKTYNKAVGTLETRVLASARKFEDLHIDDHKKEVVSLEGLDVATREFRAPELTE